MLATLQKTLVSFLHVARRSDARAIKLICMYKHICHAGSGNIAIDILNKLARGWPRKVEFTCMYA
jgi:hypothetical protein